MSSDQLKVAIEELTALLRSMQKSRRFFDRFGLATELGVSVSTIDRLVAEGRLTPLRIQRRVIFDIDRVSEELAES